MANAASGFGDTGLFIFYFLFPRRTHLSHLSFTLTMDGNYSSAQHYYPPPSQYPPQEQHYYQSAPSVETVDRFNEHGQKVIKLSLFPWLTSHSRSAPLLPIRPRLPIIPPRGTITRNGARSLNTLTQNCKPRLLLIYQTVSIYIPISCLNCLFVCFYMQARAGNGRSWLVSTILGHQINWMGVSTMSTTSSSFWFNVLASKR